MYTLPTIEELATLSLFRNLDVAAINRIRLSLGVSKVLAGDVIIGEPAPVRKSGHLRDRCVYIIYQGVVKVQLQDLRQPRDTNTILAILGAGQIVGEISLIDERTYSASVISMTDGMLLYLQHAQLQRFFQEMPALTHNIAQILADRLRISNEHIHALATLKVRTRIARQLVFLARRYGQEGTGGKIFIPFSVTQVDLANLIGAKRLSVHRVIGGLRKAGLVAYHARDHIFTILDQGGLEEQCHVYG